MMTTLFEAVPVQEDYYSLCYLCICVICVIFIIGLVSPLIYCYSCFNVQLALPLQSAMQYENYRCAQVLIEEAGGVVSKKGLVG